MSNEQLAFQKWRDSAVLAAAEVKTDLRELALISAALAANQPDTPTVAAIALAVRNFCKLHMQTVDDLTSCLKGILPVTPEHRPFERGSN